VLASAPSDVTIVKPASNVALPEPECFAAIIVTGSRIPVIERRGWSERIAAWARRVISDDVPLLGVCYDHQLMAHAFGVPGKGRAQRSNPARSSHEHAARASVIEPVALSYVTAVAASKETATGPSVL